MHNPLNSLEMKHKPVDPIIEEESPEAKVEQLFLDQNPSSDGNITQTKNNREITLSNTNEEHHDDDTVIIDNETMHSVRKEINQSNSQSHHVSPRYSPRNQSPKNADHI